MELTVENLSRTLENAAVEQYGNVDADVVKEFVDKIVSAHEAGTLNRTTIATEAWNILGDLNKGVTIQMNVTKVLPDIPEREYGSFTA